MVAFLVIYFGLIFFGGPLGYKILYPINLLVTFLHELGHAVGAILTGGSVYEINIHPNGGGYCKASGGHRAIILMGGYIGSAIFGNLLFLIGARSKFLAKPVVGLLASSMIFTGLYWYNSMFTTGFLVLFALVLFFILFKTKLSQEVLMFLGLACIIYIVQDFNVGPSSDLNMYAEYMVFLPSYVWMYIWLFIVLVLCYFNLKMVFKFRMKETVPQDLPDPFA